ncbi:MAG TPA: hypothetical protein PK002_16240 [Cellvibrio sp.]|nr:hypothetical protein [Cellvibrio sp.]
MSTANDKPLIAQRWALLAALAAYVIFLAIYLLSRDIPYVQVRADAAAWGQFGDYVGGVINPVVGLITIWLLTASLKQSQKEMALTRKALQDAEASQKATEAALRDQIKVSEQARDMNNAIAMLQHLNIKDSDLLEAIQRSVSKQAKANLQKSLEDCRGRIGVLTEILDAEAERIIGIHGKHIQADEV